jgi:FkbM family methyltransferase
MRNRRLVNFNGVKMMLFESPETISDEIFSKRNFYEYELFDKWKHYFPSDGLMLDIGANIGNHSLMYNHFFPDLEIWAFEPIFENFKLLKENTENIQNILAFNSAVGCRTGVVNFSNRLTNNSGTYTISRIAENQSLLLALDDIEFNDKKISFIKIDVEGHEQACIEGMKNLLQKHKPLIWIEDYPHAMGLEQNNSIKVLMEYGYYQVDFFSDANYLMACK